MKDIYIKPSTLEPFIDAWNGGHHALVYNKASDLFSVITWTTYEWYEKSKEWNDKQYSMHIMWLIVQYLYRNYNDGRLIYVWNMFLKTDYFGVQERSILMKKDIVTKRVEVIRLLGEWKQK